MGHVRGMPAAAFILLLAFGCETASAPNGPHTPRQAPADGAVRDQLAVNGWPFRPRAMRIHPLTRLADDPKAGYVVEIRVEFLDGQRHTTKALGEVTVALFSVSTAGPGEAVEHWTVDLSDLEVNALHFDDVTRTYLFRLAIDAETVPQHAELQVLFTSADGRQMQESHRLRMR
jgi:hypothetical protein